MSKVYADGGSDVVEPMSDLSYLYLSVGDAEVTATVAGERVFIAGETVSMRFPVDRLHLFDPATGDAIRTRTVPEGQPTGDGKVVG